MLKKMREKTSLVRDERGLTTVEYIIVLGLIAVFGIAIWRQFGETLVDEVTEADTSMDAVVTAQ